MPIKHCKILFYYISQFLSKKDLKTYQTLEIKISHKIRVYYKQVLIPTGVYSKLHRTKETTSSHSPLCWIHFRSQIVFPRVTDIAYIYFPTLLVTVLYINIICIFM